MTLQKWQPGKITTHLLTIYYYFDSLEALFMEYLNWETHQEARWKWRFGAVASLICEHSQFWLLFAKAPQQRTPIIFLQSSCKEQLLLLWKWEENTKFWDRVDQYKAQPNLDILLHLRFLKHVDCMFKKNNLWPTKNEVLTNEGLTFPMRKIISIVMHWEE